MQKLLWQDAKKFIENNSNIIYLWFGTEWCGDCKMMLPIIEEVVTNYINDEQVSFIKVDAEEANLFGKESIYKVQRVPTHIFIKNKVIKNIMYEYVPKEKIIKEIEKLKSEK